MSGLRSQREYTITCVSLKSGMASSAACFMDHQPARQAAATAAKIRNLFLTEKSMIRLTTMSPEIGGFTNSGCGKPDGPRKGDLQLHVHKHVGSQNVARVFYLKPHLQGSR